LAELFKLILVISAILSTAAGMMENLKKKKVVLYTAWYLLVMVMAFEFMNLFHYYKAVYNTNLLFAIPPTTALKKMRRDDHEPAGFRCKTKLNEAGRRYLLKLSCGMN
jgi:hypothetical protein